MDPMAIRQRVRVYVNKLAKKGVKDVTLGADELVSLQAVCYDPRYKRCVGATGKYASMTYDEVMASDITMHSVARTVKFWGIIPNSNDPLDDRKDTDNIPHSTGLDCSHQGKSQRNAVGYVGTVAQHRGWLTTNMTMFAAVGVTSDLIRVTEKFGDFRVEHLFNSLELFPVLVDSNYLITEVLGTQLYFTMVAVAMLAQRSRNIFFSKGDRFAVAYFALMVLKSYKMHPTTLKNLVSWISLTSGLTEEGVTNPWRLSTLMLEYYFGLLRTHSNTDQLTIAQMGHVTDKVT